MTTSPHTEERLTQRYNFRCDATVLCNNDSFSAHLLNISVNGALIAVLEPCVTQIDTDISVVVHGNGSGQDEITLKGIVAHCKDHYIGVECINITPDDRRRLLKILN